MGISDELRDLAATPPEATALSASLADQAVGFAVRARRVAHLKVAAAISAVTIAAAGVGIGIVTSNNDSELPTTTPVVTITSTPSGSPSSPQSSPSQAPSSQDPSSAPVLEQSQAPQQPVEVQSAPEQTTGPEPEKNIVERIIDTLASIPQWVIDQFTHQDPPAESEQTTPPSESPSQTPTNSAPSQSSTPSPSVSSEAPPSEPPSSATPSAKPSSPSGGTTPSCWVREQRRSGQDGRLYPEDPNNDPEKKSIPCEEYEKYRNQGSDPFTPDSSATRLCTIVKEEQGQSPSTPVPVPCDEPR